MEQSPVEVSNRSQLAQKLLHLHSMRQCGEVQELPHGNCIKASAALIQLSNGNGNGNGICICILIEPNLIAMLGKCAPLYALPCVCLPAVRVCLL